MAYTPPDLPTIAARVQGDLDGRPPGAEPRLRRSLLWIIGRALAGVAYGLYQALANRLTVQVLPNTATDGDWIVQHAALWGLERTAATYSEGPITPYGGLIPVAGVAIPSGTQFQRSDGVIYETIEETNIDDIPITVRAAVAGSNGDATEDTALTLISSVADLPTAWLVAAGDIIGGYDVESLTDLQDRTVARIQNPPRGGAETDYEMWALEVPGITRAWVYPMEDGPGTVTVRVVNDDDSPIIPGAELIEAVQDYIDERRPITATVTVVAPSALSVDFQISGLEIDAGYTEEEVQDNIEAELIDLLRREAEPGGTLLLSHIQEAISLAAGENDHVLNDPAADIEAGYGQIPIIGTINFV